jgi:hypothetical protein
MPGHGFEVVRHEQVESAVIAVEDRPQWRIEDRHRRRGELSSRLRIALGTISASLLSQARRVLGPGFLPSPGSFGKVSLDLPRMGLDKRDRAFQFLTGFEGWKVCEDLVHGFAPIQGVRDAVERDAGARDIVASIPFLDARMRGISIIATSNIEFTLAAQSFAKSGPPVPGSPLPERPHGEPQPPLRP